MKRAASFIFFGLFVASCANNKQIKQANPGMPVVAAPASTIELSGPWNDSDAGSTAQDLVNDCLSGTWLASPTQNALKPTIIVGAVSNLSKEAINTQPLVDDLESILIKSGKVTFVANKDERVAVRNERLDQDTNASDDSRKEHGQELGADYMLAGTINTSEDKVGDKPVTVYQVNLRLIDIKTNTIPWNGQKKIRKYVVTSPIAQTQNTPNSFNQPQVSPVVSTPTVVAAATHTATPATTSKKPASVPAGNNTVAKRIQGNSSSHIYHVPGSGYYGRISAKNLVWFDSEASAQKAGYRKAKATIMGNSATRIYHMPWQENKYFPKRQNRIYFDTESDAISAGYRRSKI